MFRFFRRPAVRTEIRTQYVNVQPDMKTFLGRSDAVETLLKEYTRLALKVEPDLGKNLPWVPYTLGEMNGLVSAASLLAGEPYVVTLFKFEQHAAATRAQQVHQTA